MLKKKHTDNNNKLLSLFYNRKGQLHWFWQRPTTMCSVYRNCWTKEQTPMPGDWYAVVKNSVTLLQASCVVHVYSNPHLHHRNVLEGCRWCTVSPLQVSYLHFCYRRQWIKTSSMCTWERERERNDTQFVHHSFPLWDCCNFKQYFAVIMFGLDQSWMLCNISHLHPANIVAA